MAYFAKLDENNLVIEVHCVSNDEIIDQNGEEQEQKGVDFLVNWSNGHPYWKQTSYNRRIRKNCAGVGYTYDPIRDAFIPPKPFPSWTLNESTCLWDASTPYPTDGQFYQWDESVTNWVAVPTE